MVDFRFVPCPKCTRQFMAHEEFFRIPESYVHCPFCGAEFGVAEARQPPSTPAPTARQM